MGMYTGLRFKGIVKKQFRDEFEPIALRGCWEEAKDKKISNFANCSRASFIPCGALCYMPDEWEEWEDDNKRKASDGFERTYNKESGVWTFQCSLKDYEDTIEDFLSLVPYFIESVEHCEVFYEGWVYSERYELIENTMVLTNDQFIKYGYDD